MYAKYKRHVEAAAKLQENLSSQTMEEEKDLNLTNKEEKEKEKENNEDKTETTEPETEDELLEFAKKYPHLRKQFNKIDAFLKAIKADPMLEKGTFSNTYLLQQLSFMGYSDADKFTFGEYYYRTDAANLIKASYEALLDSVGVSSLAAFTDEMEAKYSKIFSRLIDLRDVLCGNITRNPFAEKVCASGMMKHFVEDLKVLKPDEITGEDGEPIEIYDSVIITLHNCARNPATKPQLREYGTVTHLLPFLKCESKGGRLSTLITLSKLVDDTENEYILADEHLFEVIFEMFEAAWKNTNHYGFRWSVGALMNGMAHLAKNDSNKTVLYEKGAVPTLTKVLKDGWEREKEDAVKCIWELAFDKKISKELANNEELLDLLNELKSSENDAIRKAAKGALWEINQEERAKTPSSHPEGGTDRLSGGHVMISYQWDDQKMLKKLKESLAQNHYRVWMDVDHMAGSTLEAMAKAVEDAAVVLVCMSEKYKLSQNCRSEAGYAFSTKKDIIPLVMQRGYIPDGWLGILRESKLFFDFSGKYPYDAKLQDLLRELGQRGKEQHAITASGGDVYASPPIQAGPRDVTRGNPLSSWSEKDVHNWLTKIGLQNKPSMKEICAENLIFLRDMSRQAPEFFYNYIRTELDIKSLNEMTTFCRALDKL